jgi:hypothetical protein
MRGFRPEGERDLVFVPLKDRLIQTVGVEVVRPAMAGGSSDLLKYSRRRSA